MAKVQEKANAISLRKQGHTYKEIMAIIPNIAKGTLSRWCNSIQLTPEQFRLIEKRMQVGRDRARFQAIITNRKIRENREQIIKKFAEEEFAKYKNDPFFNFGLALYWAEGAKTSRRFQFMNSDPNIIKIIIKWIADYLKIPKEQLKFRLYIHKIYSHENHENFWEQTTGIKKDKFLKTIYKPTPHKIKKNVNYRGCLRIDLSGVNIWLKVMEWQNCLKNHLRL